MHIFHYACAKRPYFHYLRVKVDDCPSFLSWTQFSYNNYNNYYNYNITTYTS